MRNQVLQAIHLGHQAENKCILRARELVFWPGISADIRHMVKNCDLCNKHQPAQPKPPILFTTTKLSLGSCCCLIDTGLI